LASVFSKLVKQGSVYALGNAAIKASGLLLAPFYLDEALLARTAFGNLVLIEATAQLLIPLIGLGLTTAMLRFVADDRKASEHADVPITALAASVVFVFLGMMILWPAATPFAQVFLGPDGGIQARLALVYIGFKVIGAVPLMLIRARERVWLYVVAMVCEIGILIGGAYYALAIAGEGLTGFLWAYVISAGVSALILAAGLVFVSPGRIRLSLARKLLTFGLPVAAAGVALPVLHVGDRYLLEILASTEELAIYGWAARLSGALNMFVVQSFQLSFSVIGLKMLGSAHAEGVALHRRVYRLYLFGAGWGALVLSLFAYDVTAFISPSVVYLDSASLVLPLSLGFVVYGLFVISANFLYAGDRPGVVGAGVTIAALLNIGLNVIFIPMWGGLGAALATLVSYGLLGIGTLFLVGKQTGTRFSPYILVATLAGTAMLWAAGLPAYGMATAPRLIYFSGLSCAFPLLMILFRVYSPDEIKGFVLRSSSNDKASPEA
jgi:O-antigen/teichoic acid export membrane protein